MGYKNGFLLFDDEFIERHWTPEEIAEAKAKAAIDIQDIKDEQLGLITHEERIIRCYVRDPYVAENDLEDAIEDGDIEEIRMIWSLRKQAQGRAATGEIKIKTEALPEAVNA